VFKISENKDKKISAEKLQRGDLIFVHNPFITNNKTSNSYYGPAIVLEVKKPSTKKHNLEDAVEIEVFLANENRISAFWGTLWHFYKI